MKITIETKLKDRSIIRSVDGLTMADMAVDHAADTIRKFMERLAGWELKAATMTQVVVPAEDSADLKTRWEADMAREEQQAAMMIPVMNLIPPNCEVSTFRSPGAPAKPPRSKTPRGAGAKHDRVKATSFNDFIKYCQEKLPNVGDRIIVAEHFSTDSNKVTLVTKFGGELVPFKYVSVPHRKGMAYIERVRSDDQQVAHRTVEPPAKIEPMPQVVRSAPPVTDSLNSPKPTMISAEGWAPQKVTAWPPMLSLLRKHLVAVGDRLILRDFLAAGSAASLFKRIDGKQCEFTYTVRTVAGETRPVGVVERIRESTPEEKQRAVNGSPTSAELLNLAPAETTPAALERMAKLQWERQQRELGPDGQPQPRPFKAHSPSLDDDEDDIKPPARMTRAEVEALLLRLMPSVGDRLVIAPKFLQPLDREMVREIGRTDRRFQLIVQGLEIKRTE